MNKSNFKVGKKVYDEFNNILYMYSLSRDVKSVVCTVDEHGYGERITVSYSKLSVKPKTKKKTKEERKAEKKYLHSKNVVGVLPMVGALYELRKKNPTYNDEIIELMRLYIGNARYWDFILHTAADNPELQTKIKEILIKSKE